MAIFADPFFTEQSGDQEEMGWTSGQWGLSKVKDIDTGSVDDVAFVGGNDSAFDKQITVVAVLKDHGGCPFECETIKLRYDRDQQSAFEAAALESVAKSGNECKEFCIWGSSRRDASPDNRFDGVGQNEIGLEIFERGLEFGECFPVACDVDRISLDRVGLEINTKRFDFVFDTGRRIGRQNSNVTIGIDQRTNQVAAKISNGIRVGTCNCELQPIGSVVENEFWCIQDLLIDFDRPLTGFD